MLYDYGHRLPCPNAEDEVHLLCIDETMSLDICNLLMSIISIISKITNIDYIKH